jgi:carbon monoxide dehydrogenase subunit G
VTVKVGPIVAKFGGQAIFQERNDTAHRAVLKGEGRDSTGKGNASAIITAQLEVVDAGTTRCTVNTDLTITGKIAQFGRGALADVSDKLLKQFVVNLESTVLTQEANNVSDPAREIAGEAQPLNLLGSTGLSLALPILKRIAPVLILAAAAIAWLVTR